MCRFVNHSALSTHLFTDFCHQFDCVSAQLLVLVHQQGSQRWQDLADGRHHQLWVCCQQLSESIQTILAYIGTEMLQVR